MKTHLKTQGYCCQVCWVTLPVCNHEVMLRATVLAIMVVMVMLMVVVLVRVDDGKKTIHLSS